MLYSRALLFIHPIYDSLHLLTPNFQSIPPPLLLCLRNHKSLLHVCESLSVSQICSFMSYFRLDRWVLSYDICLCLTYVTQYDHLLAPPMLLQMALFHYFLWPSNIPLCRCTASCLSIPLSMDSYVVSLSCKPRCLFHSSLCSACWFHRVLCPGCPKDEIKGVVRWASYLQVLEINWFSNCVKGLVKCMSCVELWSPFRHLLSTDNCSKNLDSPCPRFLGS